MTAIEIQLDRYLTRFDGLDVAGVKVRDLVALKALLVELREGSEPPPFDLTAHMNPRQTINVLHSTCEMKRGRAS